MSATLPAVPSVSWLAAQAVISLVAASGGIIVFWGLWLEKKATKEEYLDIDVLRASKAKARRGWNILMVGIAVEVLVGFAFAVKDGWEIRQIEA